MFSNEKNPKKPQNFYCENCDFASCNKKYYTRHNLTKKHKINENQCFSIEKTPKNPKHKCKCGNIINSPKMHCIK